MVDDVFLLTVDALGARHVGFLGYDRETTPRLDELAARGRQGRTCIAQSSHTRESMPSLFYSAYPFQLGEVGPVPDDRPTIATELDDAGYATAGFHSNPYLSRAYGFDRGFDAFDDTLPLAKNRLLTFVHRVINHFQLQPYTRAEDLNRKGLDWFDSTTAERRFLWLHYMDPHGPYQPPDRTQRLFRDETIGRREAKRLWRRTVDEPETITDEERETLIDLYDAEIRYTDEMIGAFVDELKARGLLDSSLIVVAADHGDAFGQHGIYGHPRQLYEELIHVPLLVLDPSDSASRIERPVENIDIGPTILDAIDRDVPPEFEGKPLGDGVDTPDDSMDGDGGPAAFAEAHGEGDDVDIDRFAVRTDRYKYIVELDAGDELATQQLYDLSTDPDERTNVQRERTDVREHLYERLLDHITAVKADADEIGERDEVDAVVTDRLENLGYR
jgi:arylsulfatase